MARIRWVTSRLLFEGKLVFNHRMENSCVTIGIGWKRSNTLPHHHVTARSNTAWCGRYGIDDSGRGYDPRVNPKSVAGVIVTTIVRGLILYLFIMACMEAAGNSSDPVPRRVSLSPSHMHIESCLPSCSHFTVWRLLFCVVL